MLVNKLKALFTEEEGQGMTEYGLILGMVAVAAIAVIAFFGDDLKTIFTGLLSKVKTATS